MKDKRIEEDILKLKEKVDELKNITSSLTDGKFDTIKITNYLKVDDIIDETINKIYTYAMLIQATDISNEEAQKIMYSLYAFIPVLSELDNSFTDYLNSIKDLEEHLTKDQFLKEHSYVIKEKKDVSSHKLDDKVNAFYESVHAPAVRMFEQLYSKEYNNMIIDFKGEMIDMNTLMKHSYNSEKAELLFNEALLKMSNTVTTSFLAIKRESMVLSKYKGYENVLDMSLKQARMDEESFNVSLNVLDEYLPVLHEYLLYEAKLNKKEKLDFYDLQKDVDLESNLYSINDAKRVILDALEAFNKNFSEHAQKVFDNNWIDWLPNNNKQSITYCAPLRAIKESRIITNFDGSIDSVIQVAHEIGHSYHNECLYNETGSNGKIKLNLAESGSMLFENIVYEYLINNNKNQAKLIKSSIKMYVGVLLEVYSRFIFEQEIYKVLPYGPLSKDEIDTIMYESIKKTFGNSINDHSIPKSLWMTKHHYFNSNVPLYNWHYIFGLLFSKGLINEIKNNDLDVNKFLEISAKDSTYNVAKKFNIDIKDKTFWKNSIELIKDDIKRYISIEKC